MLEVLNKTKEWILDILLPKFCLGCGKEGVYICKGCELFLSEVENTAPDLVSIWEYEGLMKEIIYKIKRRGCYHIIEELVERAMEKIDLHLPQDIVITYVPMYHKKQKEFGFNPAELIATKIGRITKRRVLPLLTKVKDNCLQADLSLEFRVENVENIFSFCGCFVPQKVLLVDDYCATRATLNECSRVLKNRGIKDVFMLTLANQLSG